MDRELEVLQSLGGVARWRSLRQAGISDFEIRRAVASGIIRKSSYGVYAIPETPEDFEIAAALSGKLTCISAAYRHGLWVRNTPTKPHILVRKQIRFPSAVLHRRDAYRGVGIVVTVAEAVRQVCRCLPWAEALIVAESAVAQGKMSKADVLAELAPDIRKQFHQHLEGSAQSLLEVEVRRILRCAGYLVQAQVAIRGVGVVDLLVEGRLVIELDGFAYHSGRKEYRADRRRSNELTAQNYRLLRFTYETVMGSPEQILVMVARALAN